MVTTFKSHPTRSRTLGAPSRPRQPPRAALVPLFDSAQPAASGNPGFVAGPKLVVLADGLKREMESTITRLAGTGNSIVSSAQAMYNADNTHGMNIDAENAEGVSRVATALNGLGKPPSAP